MAVDPTLDAGQLIAEARHETGLDDLGADTLPARPDDVVAQISTRVEAAVRPRAAAVVHGLLVQRLTFFEDRRRFPLAAERIERPIITFGEARSGTTLLQMLLGCDPDARLLEFWKVMYPSPPPTTADPTTRRERADDDWREILDLVPKWLVSHPYNALLGR